MTDVYETNFEHHMEVCEIVRGILSAGKSGARESFNYLHKKESTSKIPLTLVLIKDRFRLTEFEYTCLMLALTAEMDGGMGLPSFKTARDFYGLIFDLDQEVYPAFNKGKPLYYLMNFYEEKFRLTEEAYSFILGEPSLNCEGLALESHTAYKQLPDLYGQERESITNAVNRSDSGILVILNGSHGSGRKTLAKQVSSELGKSVLIAGVPSEAEKRELVELVKKIICISVITDSIPIVESGNVHINVYLYDIVKITKVLFLCQENSVNEKAKTIEGNDIFIYEVSLRKQDAKMAQTVWAYAGSKLKIDTKLLSERYCLSIGQITSVTKTVTKLKETADYDTDDMEAVALQIKKMNRGCSLARLISPAFGLNSMIIDDCTREMLESICTTLRVRQTVYDEYGYGKLFPYGRGIGILFHGMPGTGKTMAAHAIARELGLDVLSVDISRIVDKYIGETEKHLNEIFETAQGSNCILFFDEADSLFAKRTEVGDSHDRSANTQTAFLLQKMEEYGGVVVLATNLADNIDEAFKRRLPYIVQFQKPDAQLRERLWRSFIPPELPTNEIEYAYLASAFEFSPAIIKWTAFSAAVKAIAANSPLTMEHILDALSYEYKKIGTEFPHRKFNAGMIIS